MDRSSIGLDPESQMALSHMRGLFVGLIAVVVLLAAGGATAFSLGRAPAFSASPAAGIWGSAACSSTSRRPLAASGLRMQTGMDPNWGNSNNNDVDWKGLGQMGDDWLRYGPLEEDNKVCGSPLMFDQESKPLLSEGEAGSWILGQGRDANGITKPRRHNRMRFQMRESPPGMTWSRHA